MTSAKRIHEYGQLIRENGDEKHRNKTFIQPPQDWPSRGIIEFKNYTFRYQPELDPVLKNLNLRNDSNEKIGIIGRTGMNNNNSLFEHTSIDFLFRCWKIIHSSSSLPTCRSNSNYRCDSYG